MSASRRSDLAERFLAAVLEDTRLRAIWLEGRDHESARCPEGGLDLHVAVEDPDFDAVWASHERLLGGVEDVVSHEDSAAPVDARACTARIRGGERVMLTVERASLLAKRLRTFVVPLLDRSGRFRFVLAYRRPWEQGSSGIGGASGKAPGSLRRASAGGEGLEGAEGGESRGSCAAPHLVPPKKPETATLEDLPGPRRRHAERGPRERSRSRSTTAATIRDTRPRWDPPPDSAVPLPRVEPLAVPGALPPMQVFSPAESPPRAMPPRKGVVRNFLVEPPVRRAQPQGGARGGKPGEHRLSVQWFEEDAGTGEPIECHAWILWVGEAGPYRVFVDKGGKRIVEGAQSPGLELARKFCGHRYGAPASGWREE